MPETTEVKLAKLQQQMSDHCVSNDKNFEDLKERQIRMDTKLDIVIQSLNGKADNKETSDKIDTKADKEQFIFWRNFLVSGMGLAIFLAIIALVFDKYLK